MVYNCQSLTQFPCHEVARSMVTSTGFYVKKDHLEPHTQFRSEISTITHISNCVIWDSSFSENTLQEYGERASP